MLEGDTYLQTEEHVDQDEINKRLRRHHRRAGACGGTRGRSAGHRRRNPDRYTTTRHWGWMAAVAALLLLLAGQIAHHYRQSLVAHPWLEKPMQGLYALFGVRLEPAWNLTAYDLRQLGGEALALNSTTLVLRATVHNRSPNAQPPPLIRVRPAGSLRQRAGHHRRSANGLPQGQSAGSHGCRPAARRRAAARGSEPPGRGLRARCLPALEPKAHSTAPTTRGPSDRSVGNPGAGSARADGGASPIVRSASCVAASVRGSPLRR